MARSPSTLEVRKRWKRTLRNASARRMLSPLPIPRLPRSKGRLSVCGSKPSRQNRILVTSDLRTMPRHFGDFLEAHGHCTGVFLVKQRAPLADVIEALVLVWAVSD